MVKKAYTLTLDKDVVEKVIELSKFFGGKLSPLTNHLLEQWISKNYFASEDDYEILSGFGCMERPKTKIEVRKLIDYWEDVDKIEYKPVKIKKWLDSSP